MAEAVHANTVGYFADDAQHTGRRVVLYIGFQDTGPDATASDADVRACGYQPIPPNGGWLRPSESMPEDFHTIQFVAASGELCIGYRNGRLTKSLWVNRLGFDPASYTDDQVQWWAPLLEPPPKTEEPG